MSRYISLHISFCFFPKKRGKKISSCKTFCFKIVLTTTDAAASDEATVTTAARYYGFIILVACIFLHSVQIHRQRNVNKSAHIYKLNVLLYTCTHSHADSYSIKCLVVPLTTTIKIFILLD